MRICVFEDAGANFLEPLALTRPVWALRCGASSLLERQARLLGAKEISALIRPELMDLCRLDYPALPINDSGFLQDKATVLVNARWLPATDVQIDVSSAHVGVVNGQIAYIAQPPENLADIGGEALQAKLDELRESLPNHEVGGTMVEFLWDLVDHNTQAIADDLPWFSQTRRTAVNRLGSGLMGPAENLVIADSATIEPFVVADTRQGPVLIDEGAVVHSFSRLEGPCYIGKETWVVGAKLRGGSIGPKCRIGGEVEASIVLGHSNKYHDGFLGHSYIGEWVNLAAGTQTSDLRNDYGEIRVRIAGQRIASGRTKIGSFIGDHTKTGLSALLNTGSVIGAFCAILPAGYLLPPVVPSFCQVQHGQIEQRQDIRQMFATAATVMERRGAALTETHRDFFLGLFDRTAEQRHRAIRETEMYNLRRSV